MNARKKYGRQARLLLRRRQRRGRQRRTSCCSAARAPGSPRWPVWACRCRRDSPSPPRCARYFQRPRRRLPRQPRPTGRRAPEPARAARSAAASATPRDPLLVSVRSGAAISMPGMMDTILNLGLNDEAVRGMTEQRLRRALRARLLPPAAADVRRRRPGGRRRRLRARAARGARAARVPDRRRAARRKPRRVDRGLPGHRSPPPASRSRRIRAISSGGRSARCSRAGTTSAPSDYRRLHDITDEVRHGGQRAGHGVRQPRRRLRDRRRLHPQPVDRRAPALRRVPDQRPGRGRGRRDPHAACRSRRASGRPGAGRATSREAHARARSEVCAILERHFRDMQDLEFTIEERQALHAADPLRQAHRPGRGAHRRRHGGGGADRLEARRCGASEPGASGADAGAGLRPGGEGGARSPAGRLLAHGLAGRSRRGLAAASR